MATPTPAPIPLATPAPPAPVPMATPVPQQQQQQRPAFVRADSVPPTNSVSSAIRTVRKWDAKTLMRNMRYINAILAMLQALAGFLGLFDLVMLDITSFLISVYAIIFALLLLAFECRFSSMEPQIRQQFGFLFTYRGRTAFLFCVGFMDFGMDGSLGWFVGIMMTLNGIFNVLVMKFHPEFRSGHLTPTMDPTATYAGVGEETVSLLRANQDYAQEYAAKAGSFVVAQASQNPQFVAQAGSFVVNQASQNPQLAAQVVQAYVAHPVAGEPAPAPGAASAPGTYVPPTPVTVNL